MFGCSCEHHDQHKQTQTNNIGTPAAHLLTSIKTQASKQSHRAAPPAVAHTVQYLRTYLVQYDKAYCLMQPNRVRSRTANETIPHPPFRVSTRPTSRESPPAVSRPLAFRHCLTSYASLRSRDRLHPRPQPKSEVEVRSGIPIHPLPFPAQSTDSKWNASTLALCPIPYPPPATHPNRTATPFPSRQIRFRSPSPLANQIMLLLSLPCPPF